MIACFSLVLILGFSTNSYAESEGSKDQKGEADIATSPGKIFFNLRNMKPGDFSIKEFTITNNERQDFRYKISNKFLGGSEKLYKELLLTVKDDSVVLFDGGLIDFDDVELSNDVTGESEVLTFRLEIPYELGNEYQGLTNEFEFSLFRGETLGSASASNSQELPNTATSIYNFMVIGLVILSSGVILYGYSLRKRKHINES